MNVEIKVDTNFQEIPKDKLTSTLELLFLSEPIVPGHVLALLNDFRKGMLVNIFQRPFFI